MKLSAATTSFLVLAASVLALDDKVKSALTQFGGIYHPDTHETSTMISELSQYSATAGLTDIKAKMDKKQYAAAGAALQQHVASIKSDPLVQTGKLRDSYTMLNQCVTQFKRPIANIIKRDQQANQPAPPPSPSDDLVSNMPRELRIPMQPQPIRAETMSQQWSTSDLEHLDVGIMKHRKPENLADRAAHWVVKSARKPTDIFFRNKYLHRSVMLEVVAAVPGMVGALIRHIKSLQGMRHDAENERMHLMTWMEVGKPVLWERALIATVQTGFFAAFSLLYMEEAVTSYTHFINEIDAGRIENVQAPEIAIAYWNLRPDARLRDVVLAVRADEALHRDTNHHFSDRILAKRESLFDDLEKNGDQPPIRY
ncbi:AOX-domain-containing protein [Linderina pennispora]|uniref:Alternative oxidase n=1 Tax=Linderina pennispora TaxID=61395 RepID=A0A1Y1W0A5_9FUNG|nr:AOX-domain-containing protein [Linderina pennispora]ORX66715.1 AOX-domain-containing protein [Linderina pennispora]